MKLIFRRLKADEQQIAILQHDDGKLLVLSELRFSLILVALCVVAIYVMTLAVSWPERVPSLLYFIFFGWADRRLYGAQWD